MHTGKEKGTDAFSGVENASVPFSLFNVFAAVWLGVPFEAIGLDGHVLPVGGVQAGQFDGDSRGPFILPPGSEATTRPSTRAPRSAITKPSTTSSLSRVARKASPGALRSEDSPSTRRTGNSIPAFSVTLCGSGGVPRARRGEAESRSPVRRVRVELAERGARARPSSFSSN